MTHIVVCTDESSNTAVSSKELENLVCPIDDLLSDEIVSFDAEQTRIIYEAGVALAEWRKSGSINPM